MHAPTPNKVSQMKYVFVPDDPACADQTLSVIDAGGRSCHRLLAALEAENKRIEKEYMEAALAHKPFDNRLLRDNSSNWDMCIEALIIHERKFEIK